MYRETEEFIDKNTKFVKLIGFLLIFFIGFIDFKTGYQISFSVFYLIPISMFAWHFGLRWGIFISITCTGVWILADVLTDHSYAHILILFWNALVRMTFFLTTTFLLTNTSKILDRESQLARTDFVTGIYNSHAFMEFLADECERSRRYKRPLSVVFMDCDNFKAINDTFGHNTGNKLLHEVAQSIKQNLRAYDKAGRMGGDEFIIYLSEANETEAQEVIKRVLNRLNFLMQENAWKVTFSVGIATFHTIPESLDSIIKTADELMYKAKHQGKNMVIHKSYNEISINY